MGGKKGGKERKDREEEGKKGEEEVCKYDLPEATA